LVWGKGFSTLGRLGELARFIPFLKEPKKEVKIVQPKETLTFLLIGVDEKDEGRKIDTLMVISYDPKKREIHVISIPKTTLLEIPGYDVGEVSQIFSLGRVSLTMSTLEYLLQVSINHYVKIDTEGFKHIVDELGGVKVNSQRLSGGGALKYTSPQEETEKEADRIKRQQKFITSLFKKIHDKKVYGKLPRLVTNLAKDFETDFAPKELANLSLVLGAVKVEKLKLHILPVSEAVMDNKVLYQPKKSEMEALIVSIFGADVRRKETGSLRVRVLNGVGDPGVANAVAKKLTDNGYNVIDVKNADNFNYSETQLIIYSGKTKNLVKVGRVQSLLGVGKVVVNNLPQDVADLTIVIGKDYAAQVFVPQRKVEVLNGTGRSGLAAEVAKRLTDANFAVVSTGNADRSDYDTTRLVLYVDNQKMRDLASEIKSILGVGEVTVSGVARADVEITVIVGRDY
jgi:anionic cell wall polymer biosynthesis LytR-Cps2A-Psr (LCP) family protein/predicted regulator of amino acid metabolism with ACT domain